LPADTWNTLKLSPGNWSQLNTIYKTISCMLQTLRKGCIAWSHLLITHSVFTRSLMAHGVGHCVNKTVSSQKDHAVRYVSWNLVNCYTTVQKIYFKRLAVG